VKAGSVSDPERPLAGQHAVVTGGGSGIGAAVARRWRKAARASP
jgi:NAD(P)-dependent dehydrogenase (short-subunit alcohol dehydrogenase family)